MGFQNLTYVNVGMTFEINQSEMFISKYLQSDRFISLVTLTLDLGIPLITKLNLTFLKCSNLFFFNTSQVNFITVI